MVSSVICHIKQDGGGGGGGKMARECQNDKGGIGRKDTTRKEKWSRQANDDSISSLIVCNTLTPCGHHVISSSI